MLYNSLLNEGKSWISYERRIESNIFEKIARNQAEVRLGYSHIYLERSGLSEPVH